MGVIRVCRAFPFSVDQVATKIGHFIKESVRILAIPGHSRHFTRKKNKKTFTLRIQFNWTTSIFINEVFFLFILVLYLNNVIKL